MARAKPEKTKYPGVYKRETTKVGKVYDFTYRDASGRQHWVKGKHTDAKKANDHRLRLLYQARHGVLPNARPATFESFADEWLAGQRAAVTQGSLRSSTVNQRKHDLDRHLRPALGTVRLDQIGLAEIQRLQNSLSAAGLSNHTVRRIVTTLGTILEEARRHRLVTVNQARDVRKPPAKRQREPMKLTAEQIARLASAAPAVDERNLVLVAAWTGMRQSECFGLRWANVDLAEGSETLIVAEQVYQGERVDRPKTPSGYRQIILTPQAAEALRSQQIEGRSSDAGLVFPSPDGLAWRASNFTRRAWKKTRERAGMSELHFHDLRHFYVSYIRGLGLAPALTEQLVGHSDERTHRSYTYAIPGTESLIRAAFAEETA